VDGTVQVNAGNLFPVWYQDTAGISLEQCNFPGGAPDANCIPGAPDEAFWWTSDAAMSGTGVTDALLVLALEAAYATGDPVAGQEIVFGRVRIRADVTATGTYTVTHPFGVKVYNVASVGAGNEINDTVDIGGGAVDFLAVLGSGIGPFLSCVDPAPPVGYLGNFALTCTVTGSPNNTNFFRIVGPGGVVSTTDFNVSGKLFTGVAPLPLTVDRTGHRCDSSNQCFVEVFAHSTAGAALTVNSVPPGSFTPTPLTTNNAGAFFASVPVAATALPVPVDPVTSPALQVAVTASQAGFTDVTVQKPVADVVDINQAQYNMATGILEILAASSDTRAALTEGEFGQLPGGVLRIDLNGFTAVNFPPAQVVVVSNAGGTSTKLITTVTEREVLALTREDFKTGLKRYLIRGTSDAIGATITAKLSNGSRDGKTIGSVVVGANGTWAINRTVGPGVPARGGATLIDVVSSGGRSLLNRRLNIIP